MSRPPLKILAAFVLVPVLSGCAILQQKGRADSSNGGAPAISSIKLREKPASHKEGVTTNLPSAPAILASSNTVSVTRAAYRFKSGDPIYIFFRDVPGNKPEQSFEDVIDDSGTVNLPFIGRIVAVGKTTSELEKEIEQKYIDDQIYKRRLTINIVIPQQLVFVTGEVKIPNQYRLVAGMTLTQVIATAGGLTEYAEPTKVQLIRANKTTVYNLVEIAKHPDKDVQLEAGDQIVVSRSWI